MTQAPALDATISTRAVDPADGLGDAELEACWATMLAAVESVSSGLNQVLRDSGIGVQELSVLTRLDREPSQRLPMTSLAAAVALSSGGFTKLADRMETAGLVYRQPSAHDRRVIYAVLADEGRETLARMRPRYLATLRSSLESPAGSARLADLAVVNTAIARGAPRA